MSSVEFADRRAAAGKSGTTSGLAIALAIATAASPGIAGERPASLAAAHGLMAEAGPPRIQLAAVFGRDDRRPVFASRLDLRERVGLLRHSGTGATCSAFCVAPDVIATAGHCVQAGENGPEPDPAGYRFRRDVDSATEATALAAPPDDEAASALRVLATGSAKLRTRPPINATSDWALLRLARPACRAGGFPVSDLDEGGIAARARQGRLFHVGFHRDLGRWHLAIARPCVLVMPSAEHRKTIQRDFETPNRLLMHRCDTGPASSGSPLLTDGPGGPEVVGINVGTYVRSRVITTDGGAVQRLSSETIANTAILAQPLARELEGFVRRGRGPAAGNAGR